MTQQPEHHRRPEPSSRLLAGQTILVAGGSGNVGRYIVAALLEGGAHVVVPTRSPERLDQIRKRHEAADGLLPILGDIADERDGPRLLDEALAGDAALDGAVASLGAFVPTQSILAASRADLGRAVEGYLMAHHGTARNIVPRLRDSGGTYTMIQGPLAFDVWSPESSLVSVATAAQAMLARAIMGEEAGEEADGADPPRVRVNEVVLHSAVGWGDAEKQSPLDPMDIGRYVARLASPAAAHVHGRTLHLESPDQVQEFAAPHA